MEGEVLGKTKESTVKYRFIVTLVANILKVGLSFTAGIIIARSLGPAQYGNFNFLLGSFTAFIALINMASSSAFYTIISKEKQGVSFYLYYGTWLIIQLLVLVSIVLLLPDIIKDKLWLGHSRGLILWALIASFSMRKIWQFSSQIGESIRDTVRVQIRNLLLAIFYLIGILVLVAFHIMSLKLIFALNAILYFLFSILYTIRLINIGKYSDVERKSLKNVFKEFNEFCYPLIYFTIIGFFYTFVDYWLLQHFGGSIQQGFYAIGYRFSALVLIATTSILQVFWKEISEAYANKNIKRVQLLYYQVSRGLFFWGVIISSFVIPYSSKIIDLFLGSAYLDAWLPLSLMFFYPVHQSMGQITGTMLLAIGKTKAHSYIGIFFMLISILMAYIVLAPKSLIIPGFQLGATGMALKMLCCQIIGVNISAFFVARYIKISFDWTHQIWAICLMPIGLLAKLFSEYLITFSPIELTIISSVTVSGILYLLYIAIILFFFPSIAGLNKENFTKYLND
jgi:O-antigen/teichoic acid export membrane protein